jgi:NAD(P)H-dependent FMN reductase
MLKVAIITGSTRPNRVCKDVAEWVLKVARDAGADIELLDIADFELPLLDEPVPAARSDAYEHGHTRRWSDAVRSFDAYIFVTPEYNHSIPGALKNAIDFLFQEWNDKAAGFVTYGLHGGVRAAEHLRQVTAELRIAGVRTQVALSLFDDFEDMCRFTPQPHQNAMVVRMLDEVIQWGTAMQHLRAEEQLPDAAPPPHDRGEVVIVVGRAPEKMRDALEVLQSAGFTPVGVFDGDEALRAIASRDELFAIVAGGSVDDHLAATLDAAASPKGARLLRTAIGHDDPTRHFTEHVVPELERLREERSLFSDTVAGLAALR